MKRHRFPLKLHYVVFQAGLKLSYTIQLPMVNRVLINRGKEVCALMKSVDWQRVRATGGFSCALTTWNQVKAFHNKLDFLVSGIITRFDGSKMSQYLLDSRQP